VRTLVSVVIPAYNMGSFIERTIVSALNQTHRELEIIVVDDGSTDSTHDVVSRLIARDGRIQLLTQQNAGVAAARNAGILASSGEFIAPLDADDLWHPRKIEKQLLKFQSSGPDTALVYGTSVWIDEEDHVIQRAPRTEMFNLEGRILCGLVWSNFGCASVPLIRRGPLLEVGCYDASLRRRGGEGCEDKSLYLRLAERWGMTSCPDALVGYRVRLDSMSHNARSMHRSHGLVLRETRRRNVLPPKVIRWAQAKGDRTFAGSAYRRRDYRTGAALWAQAALRDPAYFLARCLDYVIFGAGPTEPNIEGQVVKFADLDISADSVRSPSRGETVKPRKRLSAVVLARRDEYVAEECRLSTQSAQYEALRLASGRGGRESQSSMGSQSSALGGESPVHLEPSAVGVSGMRTGPAATRK
jgi:glycosyltransferase involved in cell wall biosynthesis